MWRRYKKATTLTSSCESSAAHALISVLLQVEVVSVQLYRAADGFFPISLSPHTNEALMKELGFTKSTRNTTTLTLQNRPMH